MSLPNQCRLCEADINQQVVKTSHVYGAPKGQAFFLCKACGVYYQYPPIPKEDEARLYQSEFEKFMEGRSGKSGGWHHPSEHVESNKDQVLRRLKYLKPLLSGVTKPRVLEIGCSSGFMLYPLRDEGCEVVGVEPSGIFGNFLKENNIQHYSSVEELQKDSSQNLQFDLVMHYFVLEHIGTPQEFLEENLKLVKKGGKLVVEIPNGADPLHTIYDIPEFEKFYWSWPHHWYFTESSLNYLLKKIGQPFELIRDQRYDLSNHMTWALTGRPGGMKKYTNLLGEQTEEQYKQNLIQTGLCDTVIAVITKETE